MPWICKLLLSRLAKTLLLIQTTKASILNVCQNLGVTLQPEGTIPKQTHQIASDNLHWYWAKSRVLFSSTTARSIFVQRTYRGSLLFTSHRKEFIRFRQTLVQLIFQNLSTISLSLSLSLSLKSLKTGVVKVLITHPTKRTCGFSGCNGSLAKCWWRSHRKCSCQSVAVVDNHAGLRISKLNQSLLKPGSGTVALAQ